MGGPTQVCSCPGPSAAAGCPGTTSQTFRGPQGRGGPEGIGEVMHFPHFNDAPRLTLLVGIRKPCLQVRKDCAVTQCMGHAFHFLFFDALIPGALLTLGRLPLPRLPNS